MEKRKITVDAFNMAKGIFILLMVYSHALFGYDAHITGKMADAGAWLPLYIFDRLMKPCTMPMLCLICGYGFRKKSMKKAVEGQVKFLWKPYLAVALTVAVGTAIKKLILHESVLAGLRFSALPFLLGICPEGTYFGLEMNTIASVWFVVTYILAGILLNAVLQEKRTWVQLCLVLLLACAGLKMSGRMIPFCIPQSLVCTLYMYLGWLMKKQKFFEQEIPLYFKLITLAVVLVAAFTGTFEMAVNYWKNGLADVLAGALGGGALLCLLLRLNGCEGRLANGLRWLGRNIMLFCCIHAAVYLLIPLYRLEPLFAARPLLGILFQFTVYMVTGIVCLLMIERLTEAAHRKKLEE